MSITRLDHTVSLGAAINGRVTATKVDEIIDAVNNLTDGTIEFAEHLTNTTDSTTTGTGALIVDGGVGVAKAMTVGGQINDTATTDASSSTTGAIITAGGIGAAKAINAGTTLTAGTSLLVGTTTHLTGLATLDAGATFGASNTYKGATGITAFATGGQASATALTAEENNITICATSGDSVKLPTAASGKRISVKNNGAADLAVFPATSGTINGGAANASITIPVGATKIFIGIDNTDWETLGIITTASGSAARPSHTFNSQSNQGLYSVSSTQLGVSVSGTLVGGFNASGLFTGTITEQLTGSGVTLAKNIIRQNTATALNSTGTITAAMVNKGLITSTSAAPTTGTLDTAALIAAQIGAVQGTSIEFIVDNTAGSNTFTVAVAAGIVAATPIITGGATLTVANSATQGIGIFRLVFSSASAAVLFRIG